MRNFEYGAVFWILRIQYQVRHWLENLVLACCTGTRPKIHSSPAAVSASSCQFHMLLPSAYNSKGDICRLHRIPAAWLPIATTCAVHSLSRPDHFRNEARVMALMTLTGGLQSQLPSLTRGLPHNPAKELCSSSATLRPAKGTQSQLGGHQAGSRRFGLL